MKKILLVALVAGVAFFGWRSVTRWRAKAAYEAFAEAWTHGNLADAKKYGTEECARHAIEKASLRGLESGSAMEAFRGTRYRYEKETVSGAGDLELEVHQTIFFDPPGITSGIGGAMYTGIHHSATLRKDPEGWRVVAFEPRYIDMGPLRRR
jgi:hypothetical protein